MGVLTCLFASGRNVGAQSTFLKHYPTFSTELQQKPVKGAKTNNPFQYPLATLGPVTKVSAYMNDEDSVETPPPHHCLWHDWLYRHGVLFPLVCS